MVERVAQRDQPSYVRLLRDQPELITASSFRTIVVVHLAIVNVKSFS